MEIKTSDLKLVFEKLISHIEENGTNVIEISQDYYWYIPTEFVYNPYVQPSDLTLGQLVDN